MFKLFQKMDQSISYGSASTSQVMDLYLPKQQSDQAAPLLLVVHGGAFKFGNQKMKTIQPIIKMGLERGYAVASIDYRKSDEARFPAALADVKGAVRYLKAHAAQWAINPNKLVIWGESAGAYLALMTALTPTVSSLNGDVQNDLEVSSAVQALVSFYAPVEFYRLKEDFESFGNHTSGHGKFESEFLGVEDLFQEKVLCEQTFWGNYRSQLPEGFSLKAWVQVGDETDQKVPYLQSVRLAQQLSALDGLSVYFKQIKGAGHEDSLFYSQKNLKEIFDALEKEVL